MCTIHNKSVLQPPEDAVNPTPSAFEMDQAPSLGVLILTQTALFLYENETSKIISAFPFHEIDMVTCQNNDDVTLVKLLKRLETSHMVQEENHRRLSLDKNPNFRHFFESFQEVSISCEAERLYDNNTAANDRLVLEVEIQKIYAMLLETRYNANKARMEDGYFEDNVEGHA